MTMSNSQLSMLEPMVDKRAISGMPNTRDGGSRSPVLPSFKQQTHRLPVRQLGVNQSLNGSTLNMNTATTMPSTRSKHLGSGALKDSLSSVRVPRVMATN